MHNAVYAMSDPVIWSLSLSSCNKAGYFIETAERIELVFGTQSCPRLIPHCARTEIGYLSKQGNFPLEPCPKLRTQPISLLFCHGTSTVENVVSLVRPSQVHHSERPPLFAARWQSVARLV